MVRQVSLNPIQIVQKSKNAYDKANETIDKANTAINVFETLNNIANNTSPEDPSPLPSNNVFQPLPGIPVFVPEPNNPADPRDCDAYPDSPWCGANPFTREPISLSPEIIADGCNLGIKLDGSIGFIKMPPAYFFYRNPACRIPDPPNSVVVKEPQHDIPPLYLPNNIPTEAIVFVFVNTEQTFNGEISYSDNTIDDYYIANTFTKSSFTWTDFLCPGRKGYLVGGDAIVTGNFSFRAVDKNSSSDEPVISSDSFSISIGSEVNVHLYSSNDGIDFNGYEFPSGSFKGWNKKHTRTSFNFGDQKFSAGIVLLHGKWGLIRKRLKEYHQDSNKSNTLVHFLEVGTITNNISIAKVLFDNCSETYKLIPPPPPPLNKKKKHMCCDDSLIKLLIQKVNKLSKVSGIDDYPVVLPETLISTTDILGRPIEKVPTENIETLPSLILWFIKRFDELMGQWEIPIDIEDADATQEGNQSKHIRLPNLAEAIAEMTGLLLQTTINSESLINLSTRTLLEAGMNKQQGFKNYYMLDALIDYFGFQTKESSQKLSLTFKPGESDLEKMLRETEIEVRVTELDDKTTYKSNMQDLLHAAAIIRAVHWRKFKNDGSVKEQFISLIKGYAETNKNLSGSEKDANDKDDFDKFLDDAETGFTSTNGITDSTNPYGRNYSERPKIRRIGNHTPSKDT